MYKGNCREGSVLKIKMESCRLLEDRLSVDTLVKSVAQCMRMCLLWIPITFCYCIWLIGLKKAIFMHFFELAVCYFVIDFWANNELLWCIILRDDVDSRVYQISTRRYSENDKYTWLIFKVFNLLTNLSFFK